MLLVVVVRMRMIRVSVWGSGQASGIYKCMLI
jgi:hypothetical protein